MKLKIATLVLLAVGAIAFTVGCKASSSGVNPLSVIEAALPFTFQEASAIAEYVNNGTVDPASKLLGEIGQYILNNEPVLNDAIAAAKSSGSNSKLAAVVKAIAGDINAQWLAANKVTNPGTQKEVIFATQTVVATFNAWSVSLGNGATSSVPAHAAEVLALIPYDVKEAQCQKYGMHWKDVERLMPKAG